VAAKFVAAQKAGLTPILCVGETLAEREGNVTEQVVARQLDAVLAIAGWTDWRNPSWRMSRCGQSDRENGIPEQLRRCMPLFAPGRRGKRGSGCGPGYSVWG